MVSDIELPFCHHTRMNRRQLQFLLHLLIKQDGDLKPKWWPTNVPFDHSIINSSDFSKNILKHVLTSYFKFKGDSQWLRAILFFVSNVKNLTDTTDFASIDTSGKISHKGVDFTIVPSLKTISPQAKAQPIRHTVNKKTKFSIFNKSTIVEDEKNKDLPKINNKQADTDIKLCIKESHVKQMIPTASVQLYDVVKYTKVYNKEDFLYTLNLMKTDVLSKLSLLKFRKRLRNTSRDTVKSASDFEKDLIKFKGRPNKETLKEQSKQDGNSEKLQTKVKEKDKEEKINENVIDDMNKENATITANSIPLQPNNKIRENDTVIVDLTLNDSPTKVQKLTNNLHQFLNISPTISPKLEKKIKQSPKGIKRLNRHSMTLINQRDIKSYFNPIPLKLTPEFINKKLEELKKVCRPCYVRLDSVKNLKPIRSIIKIDEFNTEIKALPIPIVMEEIDLTIDEDTFKSIINSSDNKIITMKKEEKNVTKDLKLSDEKTENKLLPKNKFKIKNDAKKKQKLIIKVKWPSKRLTL